MCECDSNRSMDIATPRNVHLSALYKRSFAFHTVKNRMPVILTSTLDNLVRDRAEIVAEYGEEAKEELKVVIGKISEFKYEVQTNKPLKPITSKGPDVEIYNEYIASKTCKEGPPTHFHTIWLLTECYMYRRIRQMFEETKTLTQFDPFRKQKQTSYIGALPLMEQAAKNFVEIEDNKEGNIKEEFKNLLKLNLWGNKCDLSISLGQVKDHSSTLFNVSDLDGNILSDYSDSIWEAVFSDDSDIIDWVFDNAGYELFTDLILADFIITKKLAKTIRFYVKTIPWFISDVMTPDLFWTLEKMKESNNSNLQELSRRWKRYLDDKTWVIIESHFWTLPFDYSCMKTVDPDLYKKLGEAKIVVFKGDLNYRKLFGEMNWDPATSIETGLQGFHPSKLCILRTLKADIVCGLNEGVAEEVEAKDPEWKVTGNWGLIQFSGKVVRID